MTNALLCIDNITVRFGGIVALDNFSLDVRPRSIQAVIGPNGAGKSTMLNVITGLYAVDGGTVSFERRKIDGRSPHRISRLGIARTFQNTELFGEMSAIENVMVGLDRHHYYNLAIGMAHGPGYRRSEIAARREAQDLLALIGLADDAAIAAAALPFGKQRRLEIARALGTRPKLLLLDEPAAGLRAAEVESLNRTLLHLRAERGMTILLIDHVMALVMAISDRISVLNFGQKIAEGEPIPYAGRRKSFGRIWEKRQHMLSVRDLHAGYGGKNVLHGVSLEVPRGMIVTLLGANGAGKSTLLKTIVGLLPRTAGTIDLDAVPLPTSTPDRALKAGVALVPEQRELFREMSVLDNLRLGAFLRRGAVEIQEDCERLLNVFPVLRQRSSQLARTLSGGEQQMLAIARALMGRPSVLLLDEPSLGLAPKIVEEIFAIIGQIKAGGTGVLLVEQNAAMALDVAEYGFVLDLGEIALKGTAQALKESPIVRASYL